MDFELTPLQRSWIENARELGRRLSAGPDAAAVVSSAASAGLLDPRADLLSSVAAVEALAEESSSSAVVVALQVGVMGAIGHDERFRGLAHGDAVAAATLSTEEVPVATDDHISGRASWVGPLADRGVAFVAGRRGDAVFACAAALDAPGIHLAAIETAGLRGIVFGHLTFDSVPCIPLGSPFPIMARVRTLLAAAGLGMGRRALREALAAARGYNRTGAGGEQTVQGLLADAATELDAAMLLAWKAASAPVLSLADASMAKLAATEAAQRAVTRATQVVGVETFRRGHVVEQLAQDVRALELFAGRTEALREAVALEFLPQVR